MNYKVAGIWGLAIVATSILFVGRLTNFTYRNLEIQLHDTYYVFDPLTIILITTFTLSLVSLAVSSIKILGTHHVLLRVVFALILSALLLIPALMLYMFMVQFFAG